MLRASTADLRECADCACFAVRRAARVITHHYDRALRASGLRATQFTLLTVLALGGPQPMSRIADRLGMERTTLTRNLKPLLASGLVRVGQAGDRRVRTISLTPRGHRSALAALPAWRRAQRAVLADQLTHDVFSSLAAVAERVSTERGGAGRVRRARR
jgi:DNA-binding MarR family transcriptional regulator